MTVPALEVVGWLAGWALIGRSRWLSSEPAGEGDGPGAPSVSVIIPARNEATRLPNLLGQLQGLPYEILVADDNSTDGTAGIASSHGVQVLPVGALPPGWAGKPWACARAAEHATGDVLVFLDADVEPTPAGVRALAARAWRFGGLVSAQPRHRVERMYERASAGPVLVTMLGAGTGQGREPGWWRAPVAFGPAMAMRRSDYASIGGHASVRGEVNDDLALARRAEARGLRVEALLGGSSIGYRIYPGGVAQLAEGWTKNLASGAGAIPPIRLAACVAWVAAGLAAGIAFVSTPTILHAVIYAAFALQVGVVLRRVGRFGPATYVLYPVALLVFVGLFMASAFSTLVRRRVRWRGRTVPTGPAR